MYIEIVITYKILAKNVCTTIRIFKYIWFFLIFQTFVKTATSSFLHMYIILIYGWALLGPKLYLVSFYNFAVEVVCTFFYLYTSKNSRTFLQDGTQVYVSYHHFIYVYVMCCIFMLTIWAHVLIFNYA